MDLIPTGTQVTQPIGGVTALQSKSMVTHRRHLHCSCSETSRHLQQMKSWSDACIHTSCQLHSVDLVSLDDEQRNPMVSWMRAIEKNPPLFQLYHSFTNMDGEAGCSWFAFVSTSCSDRVNWILSWQLRHNLWTLWGANQYHECAKTLATDDPGGLPKGKY